MRRCMNVPFDFKGKEYYAIVRHQIIDNKDFYRISIMNHRLNGLINKDNLDIIEVCDGQVALQQINNPTEEDELHLAVTKELITQLSRDDDQNDFDIITDFGLLTPF